MEPTDIFDILIIGAFGFAGLLLTIPIIQVARSAMPWKAVTGLWVSGWGFLLIGFGLIFAAQGFGGLVIIGVAVAAIGHFVQSRSAGKRKTK